MMCIFLVCLCLSIIPLCMAVIPVYEVQNHLRVQKEVVAFYSIHGDNDYSNKVVQNQVRTLNGSGLLNRLDKVFYVTTNNVEKERDFGSSDKYVHLAHFEDDNSDLHTLSLLQQFCHSNPYSKVLYFHNKISSRRSLADDVTGASATHESMFSQVMDCFVLNPNCIGALDFHDTCGWRVSPVPQIHYPGNYWWARCEYINTLVDPLTPVNNQTFVEAAKTVGKCVGVDAHSFAETWIGTGPILLPADCMPATTDTTFIYGNHFPIVAADSCHGPDHPSGLPCATSDTFKHAQLFKSAVNQANASIPLEECRDNREAVSNLSLMLYGEKPHIYLEWMDRLYAPPPFPEGQLIRFTDGHQVYIFQGGMLRGIPDLKTFIAMGRDFSEVKILHEYERRKHFIGKDLPSA